MARIRFKKEICKLIQQNDKKPEFRHSPIRISSKWHNYPYYCNMKNEEGLVWVLLAGGDKVQLIKDDEQW